MKRISIFRDLKHLRICSLTLYISFLSLSLNAQEKTDRLPGGVEIGMEMRFLNSAINNNHYKLLINLPDSYSKDSTRTFPVLYTLDGQWDFTNLVNSYYSIHWDGFIPDIIIVGITWAGKDPNYELLRRYDYSATYVDTIPSTGGGEIFLNVLRKEIIPFIDREYRSDKKNRAIAGTSMGGLYTHYLLYHASDIFNGFIMCDPSIWWDNDNPFNYESDFARSHKTLNARVFMASGEYDGTVRFQKMVAQIIH